MKQLKWLKPGGIASVLLVLAVTIGLFSVGITSEVPLGTIEGQIEMGEQGIGLPHADVVFYRKTNDDLENVESEWTTETDEEGNFRYGRLPTGYYTAAVYGKAHRIESEFFLIEEGKSTRVDWKAKRQPDTLQLNAGSRVYLPNEEIVLRTDGSTLDSKIKTTVLRVKDESFDGNRQLSDFLYALTTNRNRQAPTELAKLEEVQSNEEELKTRDIEGVFVHESRLEGMPEGVYLVKSEVGSMVDYAWLTVTDIALITKTEPNKGQAFVCDIVTGQPVEGASISLTRNSNRSDIGKTDADGLIGFDAKSKDERMTLVSAQRGKSRAYTWYYKPYDEGNRLTSHFITDRPIYRPGDTAHFKAVLRRGEPGAYTIPANLPAEVRIYNTQGDEIKKIAGKTDDWGNVTGDIELSPNELEGTYSVEIDSGGETAYAYVGLASYRKPHFEIEVTAKDKEVVRGEELLFTIRCTSYTGEPIVGAKVNANLYTGSDYWSSPFEEEYYDDYDSSYGMEFDREYQITTNENGEATVRVNTKKVGGEGEYADFTDTSYKLEANVADEGGRYYSGEGTASAKRGEFDIDASWDKYVANPGQDISLLIRRAALEGKAAPNEVEVSFGRELYAKQGYSYVEESKQRVSLAGEDTRISLKPQKAGNYKAVVTGKDSRGNEVKTEAYVWVAGGSEYTGRSGVTIALDKRDYKVGETAKVVLQSDEAGSAVWFTAEGKGLLESKIVRLDGNEAIIEVPITKDFAPNFTISVCQVAGKSFAETSRGAKVGLDQHELSVSVTPDRNEMHPGETVNLLVSTKDHSGQPVVADVALRVVDEGIYQIREDNENALDSFYPRRWSEVSTNYSFPEIYLDGEDKGGMDVKIRQDFADTAYWGATVKTDASGQATVAVKVPDNLTTWRATATAITKDTKAGKAVSQVVSLKELMLRMSLPQFLTQDDVQEVAFTLTNSTNSTMAVAYELSATGLKVDGDLTGTISVPAKSREVVKRQVRANAVGTAKLKMVGRGGAFSDGLEMSVRVQPRTEIQRDFFAGAMDSTKNYAVTMSLDQKAVTGTMKVALAPSPFSAMEPMLDDLIDYPYGCVEQTMSRFVPAVLVRSYWRETGRPRPDLDPKIDEAIRLGFARLRELQKYDGGFGWFAYDQNDPHMMALVLDGLTRIRAAGISEGQGIFDRTLSASLETLKNPLIENEYQQSQYLHLAAVSARFSDAPQILKVLVRPMDKMSAEDLAYVAQGFAYRKSVFSLDSPKGQQAWDLLKKKGTITAQSASFGDANLDSMALELALQYEPNSELARKLMTQLMATRTPRGWGDTWRTSSALKAAVTYVRTKGFTPAQGVATIAVNKEVIGEASWDGNSDVPKELEVPFAKLRSGNNSVEISFSGTGQVQYAVELEQGVYKQTSQPQSNPPGFRVRREYLPMQATRLEDGSMRLLPAKQSTEQFKSGDVFRCRLTITAETALQYVAIEDPIPSNCRIVAADKPEMGYDWDNWWSNSTFGDDHAAFFIWHLEPGEHVIEYAVRAEANGVANALPARAYPMYLRDVLASTGQNKAQVKP